MPVSSARFHGSLGVEGVTDMRLQMQRPSFERVGAIDIILRIAQREHLSPPSPWTMVHNFVKNVSPTGTSLQ